MNYSNTKHIFKCLFSEEREILIKIWTASMKYVSLDSTMQVDQGSQQSERIFPYDAER